MGAQGLRERMKKMVRNLRHDFKTWFLGSLIKTQKLLE